MNRSTVALAVLLMPLLAVLGALLWMLILNVLGVADWLGLDPVTFWQGLGLTMIASIVLRGGSS